MCIIILYSNKKSQWLQWLKSVFFLTSNLVILSPWDHRWAMSHLRNLNNETSSTSTRLWRAFSAFSWCLLNYKWLLCVSSLTSLHNYQMNSAIVVIISCQIPIAVTQIWEGWCFQTFFFLNSPYMVVICTYVWYAYVFIVDLFKEYELILS